MFDTVLVANRGEIAVRIIRTLRRLGIRSVAVYSEEDAQALHVREADVAVCIGPAEPARSYLDVAAVVRAARGTGAQAVHPGYGFLSENPELAGACAEHGIAFIGPPVEAIVSMGDKIHAKQAAVAAGVPVVPGMSDDEIEDGGLQAAADVVGYPLLLKPSAGGGGKGMRLVSGRDEVEAAVESARREARGAFGDDTLLYERYVPLARHIEIQVLADGYGNVIHLGERECSLQRRHQKIVEEAPSPLLDDVTRERMGSAAVAVARSVGYVGAGTVEFIVSADRPHEFFFMEMNTRLQVEHPVTEMVTGLDLVEWQVRIAAGDELTLAQDDVRLRGHSIEVRVYAEEPARDFMPSGGRVLAVHEPVGAHVRVDSSLAPGMSVGSSYDPMLSKVIAWGSDRAAALRRLSRALADTAVLGVSTNVEFLGALLQDPDVRAGRLDTELVGRAIGSLVGGGVPDHFFVAAGMEHLLRLAPRGPVVSLWEVPNAWRAGHDGSLTLPLCAGGRQVSLDLRVAPSGTRAVVDGGAPVQVGARWAGVGRDFLEVTIDGVVHKYSCAHDGAGTVWLGREGASVAVKHRPPSRTGGGVAAASGSVASSMPGTVMVVKVEVGDQVDAGDPLVVVEAMKMEHTLLAPVAGFVSELPAFVGRRVGLAEVLAVVTPGRLPAEE